MWSKKQINLRDIEDISCNSQLKHIGWTGFIIIYCTSKLIYLYHSRTDYIWKNRLYHIKTDYIILLTISYKTHYIKDDYVIQKLDYIYQMKTNYLIWFSIHNKLLLSRFIQVFLIPNFSNRNAYLLLFLGLRFCFAHGTYFLYFFFHRLHYVPVFFSPPYFFLQCLNFAFYNEWQILQIYCT